MSKLNLPACPDFSGVCDRNSEPCTRVLLKSPIIPVKGESPFSGTRRFLAHAIRDILCRFQAILRTKVDTPERAITISTGHRPVYKQRWQIFGSKITPKSTRKTPLNKLSKLAHQQPENCIVTIQKLYNDGNQICLYYSSIVTLCQIRQVLFFH